MKNFLVSFILIVLSLPAFAEKKLNIFTCEPEWASLVTSLAGDKVDIFQATNAFQDPHHIEARPAFIAKMRRADLVVCSGADLEVGWLPLLIRAAGNNKILPGSPGYFEAAQVVQRLGIPVTIDRAEGDVHPEGNPHVHLDPNRVVLIAEALSVRLVDLDAKNAAFYQAKKVEFQSAISLLLEKRKADIYLLKNIKVMTYHDNRPYLFDWLKIKQVATIESKPGIPPTINDLEKLKAIIKTEQVAFILISPSETDQAARWLLENTGTPYITLAYTTGESKEVNDLISLYGRILDQLIQGLKNVAH